MKPLFSSLLTIVLIHGAALASAGAAEYQAAALLSERLSEMNTLTAEFNQQITDNTGVVLQDAMGSLAVKRPRQFQWNTQQPYEHLLVTDGETLWLYDIDLEQITRQPFSADLDKAPALLLSGDVAEITRQFTIALDSTTPEISRFILTPIEPTGLFNSLTISFNEKHLVAMTFNDSFDQHTELKFSNVQLNPSIGDTLFQFKAPAGIDVISNDP